MSIGPARIIPVSPHPRGRTIFSPERSLKDEPTFSPIFWGQKIALSVFEQRTRHITDDNTVADVLLHVPSAAEVLTRAVLQCDAYRRMEATTAAVVYAIGTMFGKAKLADSKMNVPGGGLRSMNRFDVHQLVHNDSLTLYRLVLSCLDMSHKHPNVVAQEAKSGVMARQARLLDLDLLVALVHVSFCPDADVARSDLSEAGSLCKFQNGEVLSRQHRATALQVAQEVFWPTEGKSRKRAVEDQSSEDGKDSSSDSDGGPVGANGKRECVDGECFSCSVA